MTKVVLKNTQPDQVWLHTVKVSHYFIYGGKLYCKLSGDVESRGVFAVAAGIRVSIDRTAKVSLVRKFDITIVE